MTFDGDRVTAVVFVRRERTRRGTSVHGRQLEVSKADSLANLLDQARREHMHMVVLLARPLHEAELFDRLRSQTLVEHPHALGAINLAVKHADMEG